MIAALLARHDAWTLQIRHAPIEPTGFGIHRIALDFTPNEPLAA